MSQRLKFGVGLGGPHLSGIKVQPMLTTALFVLSSAYLNPSLSFAEVALSKLLFPFSWKITQTGKFYSNF